MFTHFCFQSYNSVVNNHIFHFKSYSPKVQRHDKANDTIPVLHLKKQMCGQGHIDSQGVFIHLLSHLGRNTLRVSFTEKISSYFPRPKYPAMLSKVFSKYFRLPSNIQEKWAEESASVQGHPGRTEVWPQRPFTHPLHRSPSHFGAEHEIFHCTTFLSHKLDQSFV